MESVKEKIQKLRALQEKDTVLDAHRRKAEELPTKIEEQNAILSGLKHELDDSKKTSAALMVQKKQKEMDLDAQEAAIRKHSTELNAVKSNDAYKALLTEIEHSKKEKSLLEDTILDIMEKIETEALRGKESDKVLKTRESEIRAVITALESELNAEKTEIAKLEAERAVFSKTLSEALLSQYDYIREARGTAIVPIIDGTCGGCHITLRQQLINDTAKFQELVLCDSCSRILYRLDEQPDKTAGSAA